MAHTCHAIGCSVPVPPKMFMCKKHWSMVPKSLRDAIWANYRPGQEIDKRPSAEYVRVTGAAQLMVLRQERALKGEDRMVPAKGPLGTPMWEIGPND